VVKVPVRSLLLDVVVLDGHDVVVTEGVLVGVDVEPVGPLERRVLVGVLALAALRPGLAVIRLGRRRVQRFWQVSTEIQVSTSKE
jgi:hypothetical protein